MCSYRKINKIITIITLLCIKKIKLKLRQTQLRLIYIHFRIKNIQKRVTLLKVIVSSIHFSYRVIQKEVIFLYTSTLNIRGTLKRTLVLKLISLKSSVQCTVESMTFNITIDNNALYWHENYNYQSCLLLNNFMTLRIHIYVTVYVSIRIYLYLF